MSLENWEKNATTTGKRNSRNVTPVIPLMKKLHRKDVITLILFPIKLHRKLNRNVLL